MRRIIACLLLNCAALRNAHAQFGIETNAGGTTVTITNYSGPPDVVIPSTIDGLQVTSIGNYAFPTVGITSVTIPDSVTNIGEEAFGGCDGLTNVIIPDSVTTIGYGAFSFAGLTSLVVPSSVTNMGVAAFAGCGDLTNLTISDGIMTLESNLFSGTGLVSVTIPNSVTNIGTSAFESCDSLTAVLFTGNAPAVDSSAFLLEVHYGYLGEEYSNYYAATAYYLPGTTGWAQFTSNTLVQSTDGSSTYASVPAVLWNPTIIANGSDFGVTNGQFGFDFEGTRNLPIAIEACDDLSQTNWVRLVTRTTPFGPGHFSEPFQSNAPARFYRIAFP